MKTNTKEFQLQKWASLEANQAIMPHFEAIPYKSTGSSYGACGIRIDGSPEFIDAVLSRLKDLIDGENCLTRLELARNVVDGSKLGKAFGKASKGAECCYIRLHQRGGEATHMHAYDKRMVEATERAGLIGARS